MHAGRARMLGALRAASPTRRCARTTSALFLLGWWRSLRVCALVLSPVGCAARYRCPLRCTVRCSLPQRCAYGQPVAGRATASPLLAVLRACPAHANKSS